MEEIKCEQVGMLSGGKWDKLHDQSRRVYGVDGLAPTLHTCGGGNLETKIIEPIAYDEQNGYLRQDGCVGTLTTDGSSPKHNNRVVEPKGDGNDGNQTIREILCILWKKIGEKAFCKWAIRGLWCILQTEVLRQNVYAKSILENWKQRTEISRCTSHFSKNQRVDITEKDLREMWQEWQIGCSSYRWKLSEQQFRKFNGLVQKLPYERTSSQIFVQNMWEACGRRNGILQQALFEIQKIWESIHSQEKQWYNYRIRKLTERECFRLQGVRDEDFEKVAQNQSTSSCYHLSGDSIVTAVLMAIFGELFGVNDYKDKINNLVEELKGENE